MAVRAPPGLCRFALSADLNILVRCRLDRVLPVAKADELIGDEPLDVEVDLVLDEEVFRTAQSSQAVFGASPKRGTFKPQHFVFTTKVRDLPRQCSLVVRLRGRPERTGEPARIFRGVLPLFNARGVLRQGRELLALTAIHGSAGGGVGCCGTSEHTNEVVLRTAPPSLREALRLGKAVDLYDRGCLPSAAPGFDGSEEFFMRQTHAALEAAGIPWLSIQLPVFPHPVVFTEAQYGQEIEVPAGVLAAPLREDAVRNNAAALQGAEWLLQPLRGPDDKGVQPARQFKCFVDYDAQCEHPALLKSLRLARSSRASRMKERDVRPDADELRHLNELIGRTRRSFSAEEKHLIFRFRWTLIEQPGALTKFLHAVDWNDVEERQHAIELMGRWSPVDIDDALELLSKDFRGIREVRRHAVERLERASDQDLQLYLLQLVQALRYEYDVVQGPEDEVAAAAAAGVGYGVAPSTPSTTNSPAAAPVEEASNGSPGGGGVTSASEPQQRFALMHFLIRRATRCGKLATLLYWYVMAETDDRERGALFDRVRQQLLDALGESPEGQVIRRLLERQSSLRRKLLRSLQFAKASKRDRIEKKVERFRQALAAIEPTAQDDGQAPLDLVGGLAEGIPLPVDPSVSLLRVIPEQSALLKSAMNPAVLTCEVGRSVMVGDDGSPPLGVTQVRRVMFKEGDDLRQDQLVLQLIILMDSILKKYGLDLQLTPYQVIAQTTNDGIIEFVPESSNLSAILKDHNNDIQQFFRTNHPYSPPPPGVSGDGGGSHGGGADTIGHGGLIGHGGGGGAVGGYGPHNSYGIKPEVLENFIRSSAGYCVITYILGIGDRHLDNLMVTREGRLFHIDFGFILGKDPKPFPPPMRICKEMVEGMGGNTSKGYESFKSKCCQAFKILRRHAKLIINLLYLMTDSGIKDLCGDPQFAILKVEQKFQETMDDENAEKHFLSLIEESVSALFPVLMDRMHRLAIAMQ